MDRTCPGLFASSQSWAGPAVAVIGSWTKMSGVSHERDHRHGDLIEATIVHDLLGGCERLRAEVVGGVDCRVLGLRPEQDHRGDDSHHHVVTVRLAELSARGDGDGAGRVCSGIRSAARSFVISAACPPCECPTATQSSRNSSPSRRVRRPYRVDDRVRLCVAREVRVQLARPDRARCSRRRPGRPRRRTRRARAASGSAHTARRCPSCRGPRRAPANHLRAVRRTGSTGHQSRTVGAAGVRGVVHDPHAGLDARRGERLHPDDVARFAGRERVGHDIELVGGAVELLVRRGRRRRTGLRCHRRRDGDRATEQHRGHKCSESEIDSHRSTIPHACTATRGG